MRRARQGARRGARRRSRREAGWVPEARPRIRIGPAGPGAAQLRSSSPATAARAALERIVDEAGRRQQARPPPAATPGARQKRMKEVDNLESIKEEWGCETGSDSQPASENRQTTCESFVDSLFEEAQKVDVSIKLWKNGFTVNDAFRSYSDGASQQFLNSIKKGELPSELEGTFDKEEVDVKVEDKKHEVCVSTKPVFQPFSGRGHRLGSATPKIISKAKSIEVEKKNNLSLVPLNHQEPITSVQIWLASGKRIVQKFNMSHRISHIKDFIEKYQGSPRSPPFSLATALPFLRSLDETLTLEEARLQNAVIIQRLQKTTEPFRELS
ncbi:UBX domain-containing protein 2A isoform X2 [Phyllostomus hastatus]|uniref:UBX domain-containing protein 2A isoform X2 n=1 Tax=Phyllostomus hastatus TaxID=9423 RepID=UPI001E684180|nr:UBX domain-containing protein 2A isoform X2 [Phyllostomus hastatus]